jgi:single-stranded-DNA-specific exonuclease
MRAGESGRRTRVGSVVQTLWQVTAPAPAHVLLGLGVKSPLLAQLLWNRGVRGTDAAQRFLHPEREPLADPGRMAGVTEAVRAIRGTIAAGHPIGVHGDYDADGVTATAVVVETLRRLGVEPVVFVPHRERDGYGLSPTSVRGLADRGARLIITVDCGITANAEVALAAHLGLDVVVTDHHHVPVELPAARAVLNPRQPGCGYGFRELAGVGVAFTLARALLQDALPARDAEQAVEDLLDLVALGTIADLVPLVGENRTLVARGLRVLRSSRRPGVRALLAAAGADPRFLTAQRVAYTVTPRLNAAGRMGEAADAYALLVARDDAVATALAERLNAHNRARQAAVDAGLALARQSLDPAASVVVVAGEFAPGIAGLVAGRLAEECGRPSIVLERRDEHCRGSARGPDGFHLADALDRCADLLVRYGGHAQAAGMTLRTADLPAFTARMQELASAALGSDPATTPQSVDGALTLRAVNWAFADDLDGLEPYGMGNPPPRFLTERATVRGARPLGQHGYEYRLSDGGVALRATLFGRRDATPVASSEVVRVVYEVERRFYAGQFLVELRLHDICMTGS